MALDIHSRRIAVSAGVFMVNKPRFFLGGDKMADNKRMEPEPW